MVIRLETLNLHEAADALEIEPWKLARLGRYLGIDPVEKCIPRDLVQRSTQADTEEDRYRELRHWLLDSINRGREAS